MKWKTVRNFLMLGFVGATCVMGILATIGPSYIGMAIAMVVLVIIALALLLDKWEESE